MSGIVSLNSQNNLLQMFMYVKEFLQDLELEEQNTENVKNQILSIFSNNHPGFCAGIIQFLKTKERLQLIELLDVQLNPEILNYVDESIQKEICNALATHKLAGMLSRLKETETSEILENLSPEQLKALLPSFNHFFRKTVEKVLKYPEDTAGRIMDYKIISVPEEWNIGQIKNFIKTAQALPKNLNTIFLVNKNGYPTGQIALSDIARLDKTSNIHNKVEKIEVLFSFLSPVDEIIYAFHQYDLYCAPVIDENNILVGVISISTVLSLTHKQAEDNLMYSAGIESSDFHESFLTTSLNRMQWLAISATVAVGISLLMDKYVDPFLLAILTIVTSICGASGVQVVTIIVNALDNRELFELNLKSTVLKELSVAFINAIGFCITISGLLYFAKYEILTIVIFDASLIISLIFSSSVGIMLPFILFKFNMDPALGSGAMLNAITDTVSVITFIVISKIFVA